MMLKQTPTASGTTKATTNGHALRKSGSWIESFIESTDRLESPKIFRKWAAISVVAATVEQRVFMISGGERLYPNLYCGLIGHAGTGKTRSIRAAKRYYLETPEPHPSPTSMSASSMIDAVVKSKRSVVINTGGEVDKLEYNSMYITADELTAFMHKHDEQATGTMSDFYDPQPYGQTRRVGEINIKIKAPQINLIFGAVPSKLLTYMPESAWEQGFMTRVILVFSDQHHIGDDFAATDTSLNLDLVHDLNVISTLVGGFNITAQYRDAVTDWRQAGENPKPTHPKLIYYCNRRRVHLYKLSMVSAIERSDSLVLTRDDFDRGLSWLHEAEGTMPDIFKAGAGNADARAMDEIYHYVLTIGAKGPVPERRIINFAKEHIPVHSVLRVVEIMKAAGMIREAALDPKYGTKMYLACVPDIDPDGNLL